MQSVRVGLAQIAPRLGRLDENLARHHELIEEARAQRGGPGRLPRAGADRLPAPGPRIRGRMRLDDQRLADLAAATEDLSVGRLVRRGVGRPPPVHRRGAARGRPAPPYPPQAVPAHLRAVRRAPVLRPRRHAPGGPVAAGDRRRDRDLRGLLAPARPAAARARRRADPHQRVVVARPRSRRDQRGRAGDRDVVADADAHLRPAHDELRGVLQPGRRRRVDLVLGRLRGHRAQRRRADLAHRSTTRASSTPTSRRPTSAASGSGSRSCATSDPSSRSASCRGSWPSGRASPAIRPATPTPRPAWTWRPATERPGPIGFRKEASR